MWLWLPYWTMQGQTLQLPFIHYPSPSISKHLPRLCNVCHNYLATSTYHIISLSTKRLTSRIPHLFCFLVPIHQRNYYKTNYPKVPPKNHQSFPITPKSIKMPKPDAQNPPQNAPNHFIISCFIASLVSANPVYRLSPNHTPKFLVLSLWSLTPFFCLLKVYLFFRVVFKLYFFINTCLFFPTRWDLLILSQDNPVFSMQFR